MNPEPFTAQPLTDEALAGFRNIMDPYADDVAAAIIASPHASQVYAALGSIKLNNDLITLQTFKAINDAMTNCNTETDQDHKDLVNNLNFYFSDEFTPHHFTISPAEKEILHKAALFFNTHAVEATIILAVRSLLKQYAAYNATQVLGSTQMLKQYPHRRILATMDFVLDVMANNAFEPTGAGMRSIQKLRLVHAMIRHRIKTKSRQDENKNDSPIKDNSHAVPQFHETTPAANRYDPQISTTYWNGRNTWNAQAWGEPINQQDMIFAVHTFSVEVLDGLIESGEKISEEDKQIYYMAWNIIGRLLGVNNEINPTDYYKGKALQQRIYNAQFKFRVTDAHGKLIPNPIAPALATPLVTFIQQFVRLPKVEYVYAIIKHYNNDVDEKLFDDLLGLPLTTQSKRFEWLVTVADKCMDFTFDTISVLGSWKARDKNVKLANRMHYLMRQMVVSQSTWGSEHFRIGDGFGERLGQEDAEKMKQPKPSLVKIAFNALFAPLKN